jgi:hypothetical protein
MLVSFLSVSCAATNATSPWNANDLPGIKGQSVEMVIQKFGQPNRKSIDSNGRHVWQYQKSAESQGGMNRFAKITSFGMSGDMYIDLLTLYISDNRVINFTYQENIVNAILPTNTVFNSGSSDGTISAATVNSMRPFQSDKRKGVSSPQNISAGTSSELVFTSAANIRDIASNKGKILFKAIRGKKAIKVGSSGNWRNIKLASGLTGWVSKSVVLEVFP